MDYTVMVAGRIPPDKRKIILEERFIDKAVNTETTGTPMEYLFDVYEEYIDVLGEHDNWMCYKCREHILGEWRKLKPYLEKLQNAK